MKKLAQPVFHLDEAPAAEHLDFFRRNGTIS